MSAARGTTIEALRSPSFALLWCAGLVSGTGDKISLVALAYVSWSLTASALPTALAVVIATVPIALFGFFAGAIADSVGRKRSMVTCDLLRVILIGLIPIALIAGAPLALAYALAFVAATCGALFKPARVSLLPDLVSSTELPAANSLVLASDRTVEIVGAMFAGIIVAAVGVSAFYVDALSFGISALLLSRMRITEGSPGHISWARIWDETASGIRVIRRTTLLWTNTVFSLVAQLSLPVLNGLIPVLVFKVFAGGAAEFAAVEAAIAAGAVAAGVTLPPVLRKMRKGTLLVTGFGAFGISLVLVAAAPTLELLLVAGFFVGVTNLIFYVPNLTLIQEAAPAEYRARVFGARLSLLNLTWIPVIVVTGALADGVGAPLLIAIAGLLTLGTAVVGAFIPAIRDVA